MASEPLPFKKRVNPIGEPEKASQPKKEATVKEKTAPKVEKEVKEKKPVQKKVEKVAKNVESVGREKYTATMEHEMRINVKIAAAKKGIQVSQYIEEAIQEKLEREGL